MTQAVQEIWDNHNSNTVVYDTVQLNNNGFSVIQYPRQNVKSRGDRATTPSKMTNGQGNQGEESKSRY